MKKRESIKEPFTLKKETIEEKYSETPEHAAAIINFPRVEREVFEHIEGRINGKLNEKFLENLFKSKDAESTIETFKSPSQFCKIKSKK